MVLIRTMQVSESGDWSAIRPYWIIRNSKKNLAESVTYKRIQDEDFE